MLIGVRAHVGGRRSAFSKNCSVVCLWGLVVVFKSGGLRMRKLGCLGVGGNPG